MKNFQPLPLLNGYLEAGQGADRRRNSCINAVLWEQVKFTAGRASVSNFNNTRKIKLREMPQINISIMPANPNVSIGGVGEPGVPSIAPAIANAYVKLTGNRIRRLPFSPQ